MQGLGVTNKKSGLLTFQGTHLFLVILEGSLKGLGCMKDSKNPLK